MSADPIDQPARPVIHLDIDRLATIARHGGLRASWFLGLTFNAMSRTEPAEHRLGHLIVPDGALAWPIELVPAEVSPEILEKWKGAFVSWVIGSCLRELLEHYALMLDEVNDVACLVHLHKRLLSEKETSQRRQQMKRATSVGRKLKLIEEWFGLNDDDNSSLSSLYQARNVLTHGFGIVRARDAGADGDLTLQWSGFNCWARGQESGNKHPLKDLIGRYTAEEMIIEMQPARRTKIFKVGEQLTLKPMDMSEICYFVSVTSARRFLAGLVTYLQTLGVAVSAVTPDPSP